MNRFIGEYYRRRGADIADELMMTLEVTGPLTAGEELYLRRFPPFGRGGRLNHILSVFSGYVSQQQLPTTDRYYDELEVMVCNPEEFARLLTVDVPDEYLVPEAAFTKEVRPNEVRNSIVRRVTGIVAVHSGLAGLEARLTSLPNGQEAIEIERLKAGITGDSGAVYVSHRSDGLVTITDRKFGALPPTEVTPTGMLYLADIMQSLLTLKPVN